jgi:hypothetical protein
MPMPRSIWTGLGWVGASAIGVVVGLVLGRGWTPDRSVPSTYTRMTMEDGPPSNSPRGSGPAFDDMASRMGALEKRLGAVESTPKVAPSAEPAPPPGPPNPEEMRAQTAKVQADLLARMNTEGVDPRWAPRAESSFAHDLQTLGEGHDFVVRHVNCRTTMCSADIEWPNGSSTGAPPRITDVVAQHYEVNCQRFGRIAQPDDPSGNYTAKVIFDCEQERAESN